MAKPRIAPYGAWKSPITSELIVSDALMFGLIALDGEDIYWTETRPAEGGRTVLVRRAPDGRTRDLTPPRYNVRSRVHEYGGGEFAVGDGEVYFSNFADGRLYRQTPDSSPLNGAGGRKRPPVGPAPRAITPAGRGLRYADLEIDRGRRRLIAVREDHGPAEQTLQPANTLVSLPLQGGGRGGRVLAAGNDFYAAPRLSPDGKRLAWLTWNHPNLPWDGCELWVANLRADGTLGRGRRVAGGAQESIVQPEWSPDGVLHFVSDRSGWWNLYRWREGTGRGGAGREGAIEALCPMEAEFAAPHWRFGASTYAFASARHIVFACTREGSWHLARLDTSTGLLDPIETPYTHIAQLRVGQGCAVFLGGAPDRPTAVVLLDLASGACETLRATRALTIEPDALARPEAVEFATTGKRSAHAWYYAPRNPAYAGPAGARPPLIVMSHGGPTSASPATLDLEKQFWTSRGIAVLDVNYGGSTGYGRDYRQRLEGQWGVVDVEDCIAGARYLAERGDVDGDRLAITGGSAGGYTTLCAVTFHDVFKAGSSHFGISDLEIFAQDTHKFESRYLDSLIGPYPARKDLYQARSALHFTGRISCPLILFQGLDDRIVPPNQAEVIVAALRAKRLPVAYLAYEGEGHGFRRAENIRRTLEAELYFYGRVFGFTPADTLEPVEIANL